MKSVQNQSENLHVTSSVYDAKYPGEEKQYDYLLRRPNMATSNQIAQRQLEQDKRRLAETVRANQQQEHIGRRNASSNERNARSNRMNARSNAQNAATNRANMQLRGAEVVNQAIGNLHATSGDAKLAGNVMGALNDPNWYNENKQLVDDAAKIAFGPTLGTPQSAYDTYLGRPGSGARQAVPGHMAIYFVKTVGNTSDGATAPINVAAKKLYAFVRHANSGSRNYDSVDLMQYVIAIDELNTMLAWGCKIYSLLNTAKMENFYYSQGILENEHVDYGDFVNHISDLRAYINCSIIKAHAFAIPQEWSITKRHVWLVSSIFKDADVKRSQEYTFVPLEYKVYDDTDGNLDARYVTGTPGVDYFIPGEQNLTYADYTGIIDAMIEALTGSEDIGIMSGDILKAYGGAENLFELKTIPEDFHIESVHSMEVLSQISGATLIGLPQSIDTLDIYQDNSGATSLLYQGSATSSIYKLSPIFKPFAAFEFEAKGYSFPSSYALNALDESVVPINMYKDDVTPDDVMVATRLTVPYTQTVPTTASNAGAILPQSWGTEICCFASVCQYSKTAATSVSQSPTRGAAFSREPYASQQLIAVASTTGSVSFISPYYAQTTTTVVEQISKFDWAPRIRLVEWVQSAPATSSIVTLGEVYDLANYAFVTKQELDKMNLVAVMAQLHLSKDETVQAYR